MGSSLLAISDGHSKPAVKTLQELSEFLWKNRSRFDGNGVGVGEAIKELKNESSRTCLLDMGDNVGGGSSGDGTMLAQALIDNQMDRSFVCLYDPQAVELAASAGTGRKVFMEMGGKTDEKHGKPVSAEVTVVGIHSGLFEEVQPRHGGFSKFDQGKTAVVETVEGITLMLTTKRMAPFSLHQFYTCGLDPEHFKILVAKGVNAPIAAYREVSSRFIRVDTPGTTASNLNHFEYRSRRRPMHPFETDFEWTFPEIT